MFNSWLLYSVFVPSGVFVSMSEVPLHSTDIEDFKVQMDFLLSHYNIQYDISTIKTAGDEMELFSLVILIKLRQ